MIDSLPDEDLSNEAATLAAKIIETTGANLFLTGKAGTGKTTFLHRLRQTSSKRIVVLAPTGIAAINAGGMTIHSFFQLGFTPFIPGQGQIGESKRFDRFSRDKLRVVRTMDLLVIDEISMVRADLLDAVDQSLRRHRNADLPFGGVQLLLIGDLAQLPPVVREDEWTLLGQHYSTPYFFSSLALRQTRCLTIELDKVYRQDEGQFLDILNSIRDNAVSVETLRKLNTRYIPSFTPPAGEQWIRLVTHNIQAQRINDAAIQALSTPSRAFQAKVEGDFPETSFPADFLLQLKAGAHVMFIKNDSTGERRYYNGLLGEVKGFEEDSVIVAPADGGELIMVGPETWDNNKYEIDEASGQISENIVGQFTQIPLRLAWAITIHKSQGLTFDRAIIDAASSFTHGQTYVALSRCRTIGGLVLERPIDHGALICDQAVMDYLSTSSAEAPDAAAVNEMQRAYVVDQLDDLFNFVSLLKAVEGMARIMASDFYTLRPRLVEEWQQWHSDINDKMCRVAETFGRQYRGLLAPADAAPSSPNIDDRIRKGAHYFYNLLIDLKAFFMKTPLKHDNKQTMKRLNRCKEELREELELKLETLEHVVQNGFDVAPYLKARAQAWLKAEGGGKSTRRLSTTRRPPASNPFAAPATPPAAEPASGVAASPLAPTTNRADGFMASVRTSAPKALESQNVNESLEIDDIRDEALFETLRIWRMKKAKEIGRPAFCVLYNKTLAAIVNANPKTLEELAAVSGMGPAKVSAYGVELLALLKNRDR